MRRQDSGEPDRFFCRKCGSQFFLDLRMTRVAFERQQLLLFFHRRTGGENATEEPLRYAAMAKLKRRTTHRFGGWGVHRPRGGFVSDGCPCAQRACLTRWCWSCGKPAGGVTRRGGSALVVVRATCSRIGLMGVEGRAWHSQRADAPS